MSVFDDIKSAVTIFDVMDKAKVKYSTTEVGHKVFCPFHDDTTTKSGYVYPDTDTFRCFVCSRSWDVIDFWARYNEWYKPGQDDLDAGRAVGDLARLFSLQLDRPEWEKKLAVMRTPELTGFAAYPLPDRVKMRDYYVWDWSLKVRTIPREARSLEISNVLCSVWDKALSIPLAQDEWRALLEEWQRFANESITGVLDMVSQPASQVDQGSTYRGPLDGGLPDEGGLGQDSRSRFESTGRQESTVAGDVRTALTREAQGTQGEDTCG